MSASMSASISVVSTDVKVTQRPVKKVTPQISVQAQRIITPTELRDASTPEKAWIAIRDEVAHLANCIHNPLRNTTLINAWAGLRSHSLRKTASWRARRLAGRSWPRCNCTFRVDPRRQSSGYAEVSTQGPEPLAIPSHETAGEF